MNGQRRPFVSVIIPVYNDPQRLRRCLKALEEQTYPKEDYEVLVIDNNSENGISHIVEGFRQAKAGFEARPGSFIARNTGIRLARGTILAFTDADCIPEEDWIEQGEVHLSSLKNGGIVGGRVMLFFRNPECPSAVELYDRLTYLDQQSYIESQNFSATANMFTFKQVFEKLGLFAGNQNSLDDSDDQEWGQRVAAAGYALSYAPDVRVAHPARASLAQLLDKERRVASGSTRVKLWTENLSPSANRYQALIRRLPLLPPVFKLMSFKNAGWRTKFLAAGIGCLVTCIQVEIRIREKLRRSKKGGE